LPIVLAITFQKESVELRLDSRWSKVFLRRTSWFYFDHGVYRAGVIPSPICSLPMISEGNLTGVRAFEHVPVEEVYTDGVRRLRGVHVL
jgi:hypothetical protein